MPKIKLLDIDETLMRFDDPTTHQALFKAVYAISQCVSREYDVPMEGDRNIFVDLEILKLTEIEYILDNLSKFYSVMVANERNFVESAK